MTGQDSQPVDWGDGWVPDAKRGLEESAYTCQEEALARMLCKQNVMLSGVAGAGKTTLVNRLVSALDGRATVAVTSSTGTSAMLINGSTIHSWSGLGVFDEPVGDLWNKDRRTEVLTMTRVGQRFSDIRSTDVLVIDEVSMLPAYFFDNLDEVCRFARRFMFHRQGGHMPFGGLQLILSGDFLQLPPVSGRKQDSGHPDVNTGFITESKAFREVKLFACFLDHSYRTEDARLMTLLSEIEHGQFTKGSPGYQIMSGLRSARRRDKVAYTTLYTTNRNVDKYNEECLGRNGHQPFTCNRIRMAGDIKEQENLIRQHKIPETVTTKVGAVMMVTSNIITTRDKDGALLPSIRDMPASEAEVAKKERYASNGTVGTVTKVILDGTVYTADDEEGTSAPKGCPDMIVLHLNDGRDAAIEEHEYVKARGRWIDEITKMPWRDDFVEERLDPKNPNSPMMHKKIHRKVVVASVCQFPLRLGYAITVHKSQGRTLDGVSVDLSQCFSPGLGYVALSRVRSADRLLVKVPFPPPRNTFAINRRASQIQRSIKRSAIEGRAQFERKPAYMMPLTDYATFSRLWPTPDEAMDMAGEEPDRETQVG